MPWDIDLAHTSAQFAAKHMGLAMIKGYFRKLSCTLEVDEDNLEHSSVEAEVDVDSIDTNNERRDNHLRSADFFDVANHPKITLKSRHLEPVKQDRYRLHADLTIRGATRQVAFDVTHLGTITDQRGNRRIGFSVETTINRRDFGLPYSAALPTNVLIAGDVVKISIEGEAIKRA
ncbi:MAG: YceI family protein [Chloroflexi bacterium]|nr:YceI family protein [Chloroflexota bacterium]